MKTQLLHLREDIVLILSTRWTGLKAWYWSAQRTATLKLWFGLANEEQLELSTAIASILEQDQERVITAIADALSEESAGNHFIEYGTWQQGNGGHLVNK